MMPFPSYSSRPGAVALLALWTFSAFAFTTDFEADEGYTPGVSLVDQTPDNVRWHGKTDLCTLVAGEGVDGGQAIQLHPIGDFATVHIQPPAGKSLERLRTSVSVRIDDPVGGSFQVPVRLRFALDGEAEALRIHFYEGGKIEFFSDSKAHRAKTAEAEDIIVRDGVYNQVEAELDFTTHTYRLKINGIEQQLDGKSEIPFMNAKERKVAGKFEITGSHRTANSVFLDRFEWVTQK